IGWEPSIRTFGSATPCVGCGCTLNTKKQRDDSAPGSIRSTIIVFGAARVLPRGSADETESTAPLPPRAVPRPGDQSARWYEEARRFGRSAPERGGALRPRDGVRDNVITTGGGPGRLVILWWCQTIQA